MKHRYLFLFLVLCGLCTTAPAQDMYRTIHGDVAISINDHDSTILLISNQLSVSLDYETSRVSFKVGYETFSSRIDSIDAKLNAMKGSYLEFTGKLGITINTQNFTPQKYNMEGQITSVSPPAPVRGNGSMNCLPAGDRATPACTFLVTIEATLTQLQLKDIFPLAKDGVRVDVRQSILERDNE